MTKPILVAACLLAARAAFAQPDPAVPPPPPASTPPVEQPVQPHPPEPPPPTVSTVQAPATDAHPFSAGEAPAVRPEGFSVGVGVGYSFPTSLQSPNVSSVRFRLISGITLEPSVVFASSSHSVDTGMALTQSATELGVGLTGRFPVISRHRTDLEILATLELDRLSTDPDEDTSDDVTEVTTVTGKYGLAVGLWMTPHLQLSLSAMNSVIAYTHQRQEQGIDTVTVTNDTTFGLIFHPTVLAMIHLYN